MPQYQEMANERLVQLKQELASGQEQMAQLENRISELRQTMLRISGAIQVLEELDKNVKQTNKSTQ